jgi:hypothetical protein
MAVVGLYGSYGSVAVVFAVAIFSALVSGVAYIVVLSVISGYGARDSSFGPMDESGTQHEWTAEQRERFKKRRRLALIVAACVGLTLFGIGLWLVSRAVL